MGDRANIHIKYDNDDPGVFLYTHWRGTELPEILQEALALKERWNDPQYLTRIIFSHMVRGAESATTGFGIGTILEDGADRVLIVNCEEQIVARGDRFWSFNNYTGLSPSELSEVWYERSIS